MKHFLNRIFQEIVHVTNWREQLISTNLEYANNLIEHSCPDATSFSFDELGKPLECEYNH